MSPKQRLLSQALDQTADRVPTIGGWILGASNLAKIGKTGLDEFLAHPMAGVLRAHRRLGVDGMVTPVVPTKADQIRTGMVEESSFGGIEPEDLLTAAQRVPEDEAVLARFDYRAEEERYRRFFLAAIRDWTGIVPMPNFWEIGGHFPLYTEFGYTAFLSACALYPDAVERIWRARSLVSRERAKLLVGLYREFELVPMMFCGEDLCSMQGPLCSLDFLRTHYFPTVKMIVEPLVDAGIRLVHHCDGDVRTILSDILDIGFRGFQGFQYECGVSIKEIRSLRTAFGEPPLIWAGMSVSRSLPLGSEDDVRAEVEGFYHDTDGGHGLFVFTSNVSGIEVPYRNLVAGYARASELTIR